MKLIRYKCLTCLTKVDSKDQKPERHQYLWKSLFKFPQNYPFLKTSASNCLISEFFQTFKDRVLPYYINCYREKVKSH